jgi:hypothetical protein
MPRTIFATIILLFFILGSTSCSKGPNEGVPAYLKIDSLSFTSNSAQGSAIQFIPNLWLESEGENIGVYELPLEAPVLVSGEKQVIVNAGVYANGDFFNREIYPAFQPYRTRVNFVPGETVFISPSFSYYDECVFPLNEDFENGNIFGSLIRTDLDDINNIEGRALHIPISSANVAVRGVTTTSFVVPLFKKVYLEIHFKGDIDFALGIESLQGGAVSQILYIDRFFPTSNWTRIYYDISDLVYSMNGETYNMFIEVVKLSNVESSEVFFDNVKIVVI